MSQNTQGDPPDDRPESLHPQGEKSSSKDLGGSQSDYEKEERRRQRAQKIERVYDAIFGTAGAFIKLFFDITTPIFSAISIWVSVIGIAFTLFSGVEPFIAVAHWIRFLTIKWRDFTHTIWDYVSPYLGFQIPIDLKDFATFLLMISIALIAGLLSRGRRLVVHEAIVGIRMAIYGISHAIGPTRQGESDIDTLSRLKLLFFEINIFLGRYIRSFLAYSFPILAIVNIAARVAMIYIPMIILVPESAFEKHFYYSGSRVEYIVLSAFLSYSAAIIVISGGILHVLIHFARAISLFLLFSAKCSFSDDGGLGLFSKLKIAFVRAKFGLTYKSVDPVRKAWNEEPFLTRLSAAMIRTNWTWFPVSKSEKVHRKFDLFLALSERRFAEPAFTDRIVKGLFLFFLIYAMNWVSVNGDDIATMFRAP